MPRPDRSGPAAYPGAFCCAWTVQHTGTWFLGATLKELTGFGGTGWPPPTVGKEHGKVGYRIQHLYGLEYCRSVERGPGNDCDVFEREWIDGTDLPIVTTLRHPQWSVSTFVHRYGTAGVRGYTVERHVDSFFRLVELLTDPRVRPFCVDAARGLKAGQRANVRLVELELLMAHIGVDAEPDKLERWATGWPRFNSRGAPLVLEPRVPDDIVEALGYEPLEG